MNRRDFLCGVTATLAAPSLPIPSVADGLSDHDRRCARWSRKFEWHRKRVEKILNSMDPKWGTVYMNRKQFQVLEAFYWEDYDDGGGGGYAVSVAFDVYELERQTTAKGYRHLVEIRVADAMYNLEELKEERRHEKTC